MQHMLQLIVVASLTSHLLLLLQFCSLLLLLLLSLVWLMLLLLLLLAFFCRENKRALTPKVKYRLKLTAHRAVNETRDRSACVAVDAGSARRVRALAFVSEG